MIKVYSERRKSDRDIEDLESRISWQINFVKNVYQARTGKLGSTTNRPFVGQMIENRYLITRTNRSARNYRPKVYCTLNFVDEGPYRSINIKVNLGVFPFLIVVALFLLVLIMVLYSIMSNTFDDNIGYIITQFLSLFIIVWFVQEEIKATLEIISKIIE